MKKFNTLFRGSIAFFLLFLAFFALPRGANAVTYQIGTGTTTNTLKPIYTCYGYNYSQHIYTAAELNAAGAFGSQTITAIRFFYVSGGTTFSTWNNWTVYIGNTAQSAFASATNWVPLGSMTQVFSGTIAPVAGTWVTLTLSTPFVWNGTSNLVVGIDENSANYSCTASWRSYTSATGNRSMLYYSDITNPNPAAPPTANSAPSTGMAQIQFEMNAAVACSGAPAGGTSSISLSSGCSGTSFTLSNTGASSGSGISYVWQSAPAVGGPWTNIGGATSTSYTTSAAVTTYYRLLTTCSNSGISTPSNVVSYTVAGSSCNYTFRLTDSYGDGWNGATMQVRIGATVIATLGPTFATGTQLDIPLSLCGGTTYNLYYVGSGSYPSEVGIQILNNTNTLIYTLGAGAGTVGTTLYTFTASCPSPPTLTSFSPTTACGASTTVTLNGTNFTGATAVSFGGVPAQSFTVVNATTITAIPGAGGASGSVAVTTPSGTASLAGFTHLSAPSVSISSVPASAVICGAGSVQLTATGSGIGYTWDPGALSGAVQTVSPVSNTVYTVTSTNGTCTNAATVLVQVAPLPVFTGSTSPNPATFCDLGSATLSVSPGLPSAHCIPTVSSSGASGDYISNVNVNSGAINNSTGDGPGDYNDYSALVANVTAGMSYPVSVTTGPTYSQGKGIFIDYNKNGVFTDPGEFVWSAPSAIGIASGNFTVPASASNGLVRMRVVCFYVTQPTAGNSCNVAGFGEYEDYRLNISGGTGPQPIVSYTWSPATFLSTTSGVSTVATNVNTTTNYIVTAADGNGCTATSSLPVTINNGPALNASSTPVSCNGGSNGTATVSVISGTPPYSYSWAPSGGSGQTATGLSANTYTVTVTDGNGCTQSTTVAVTEPAVLAATIGSSSPVSCNGGSNGTAGVSVSGGTAPYSYSWAPFGGAGSTTAVLTAGTFTVTVTDDNGCTATASVIISEPSALTISAIKSNYNGADISCAGATDGQIALGAGGGTPNYTYSFNGGVYGATTIFNALSAAIYTVAAQDANGCTVSSTVVIAAPAAVNLSLSATNALCNGANGNLTFSGGGGTGTLAYTVNGTAQSSPYPTPAGTYTVVLTDANGCSVSSTTVITEPPALVLGASPTDALCNGVNGSLSFSATGGTGTINYTVNGTAATSPSAQAAGTYTIVATDANNCTASTVQTITQPASLLLSASASNALCNGANGSLSFSATGGTGTINYTVNGTAATSPSTQAAGTYTIVATDANSCTASTVQTITQPALLVLSASANNALCNAGNGSLTFSTAGGTGTVSYTVNGTAATSPSAHPAGTYTIVATDANNCTASSVLTITQPLTGVVVSVLATQNPTCASTGIAVVSGVGGTGSLTYSINPNIGTQVVAGTFTGLSAQGYTITATDANGCTATTNFTLSSPALPVVTVSSTTPILCNGGTSTITAVGSGGTPSYTYSLNGGAFTASGVFASQPAGTYNITVMDANNCTGTTSVNIVQPTPVSVTAGAGSILCTGGTATITASAGGGTAGYQYQLNGGALQASGTFAGNGSGTYTITAVDANGCSASTTVLITQPSAVTATMASSTNVSCNGGSNGTATVLAGGGTPGYTYSWSPSGGTSTTASGLPQGTYVVTVTDANGCTASSSVNISQPTTVVVTATASNAPCNGGNGSLSFSATGGTGTFTYTVNGTAALSPSAQPFGTYTVVATDGSGCTASATASIGQPPVVSVSATPGTIACFGGNTTITVSAAGGTGTFTYSLNGGTAQASNVFSNLLAGTYTVTAFDANNCSAATLVTVTQPADLSISAVSPTSCPNQSLILSANVSGGTPGYTYLWTVMSLNGGPLGANTPFNNDGIQHGESTTSTFPNPDFDTHQIQNGVYSVRIVVSDTNSCKDTLFFTITVQQGPNTTISASTAGAVCSGDTVTYTVPPIAGNGSYAWTVTNGTVTAGGGNTQAVTVVWNNPLTPNTVSVTVDQSGCIATNTISVTVNPSPSLVITNPSPVCAPATVDITLPAVTAGSSAGLTLAYFSNAAATTPYLTPTTAGTGTYYIRGTDAIGCKAIAPVSVLVHAQPVLTASAANAQCNGANGSLTFSATGAPSISYTVNGTAQSSPFPAPAGTFTVQASDGNNCTASSVLTVTQPAAITLNTSATNAACNGGNGALNFSAAGGTGSMGFTVNGNSAVSPFSATAGTYTIVATDANGCSASTILTIGQPAGIVLSASATDPLCNGNSGSLTFNATGGAGTIVYTVNGTAQSSPYTAAAGNYTVVATDGNGCSVSTTLSVVAPAALTLSATTASALCNGANGSLTISASGGTGAISFTANGNAASAGANALPAGTYTIVATDANNCSVSTVQTISQPPVLSIGFPVTLQAGCYGTSNGIFQMIGNTGGTAPYTFSANPSLTQPISGTFTGTTNGTVYTITLTDANGCSASTTVQIGNPLPVITVGTVPVSGTVCSGTSVTLTASGAGAGGTYSWTGGIGNGVSFIPAASTTYTVTGSDVNGCTSTASASVTVNSLPVVTASASPSATVCNGSPVTLLGGGALTYTWNGVSTLTSDTTLTPAIAGNYTVVGTDINGCTNSAVQTVSTYALPPVTASASNNPICLGASVALSGGGALNYSWSGGISDATPFTPASAGTTVYTVTGTDANGCSATAALSLTVNGVGTFTPPTTLTASCPSAVGSSFTIASTGAAGPVAYTIAPLHGTQPVAGIFNGLIGGDSYTVTLSDANGCTASTAVTAPQGAADGTLANALAMNAASAAGNSCKGQNQPDGALLSFYGATCNQLIATVQDAPGGNALGNMNACVTVTPTVQTYNGQPYLRRSFDLIPQNQGPALITFYFTHEDITGYNANAGSYPQILNVPATPANGNTISFLCSQVPQGFLPGAPGGSTVLHNITATWNAAANRWETTIAVNSFSGFYFHTGSLPLPVAITSFDGHKQSAGNDLQWVTSSEQNNARFVLQHSTDALSYRNIAEVQSQAAGGNSNQPLSYSYLHTAPELGHNYYRLQQVDLDGQTSMHAKVVDLIWTAQGSAVSLHPNPVRDVLYVDLYAARAEEVTVKLMDLSGRTVQTVKARTNGGQTTLSLQLGDLAAGVYTVQVLENNRLSHTGKVEVIR